MLEICLHSPRQAREPETLWDNLWWKSTSCLGGGEGGGGKGGRKRRRRGKNVAEEGVEKKTLFSVPVNCFGQSTKAPPTLANCPGNSTMVLASEWPQNSLEAWLKCRFLGPSPDCSSLGPAGGQELAFLVSSRGGDAAGPNPILRTTA